MKINGKFELPRLIPVKIELSMTLQEMEEISQALNDGKKHFNGAAYDLMDKLRTMAFNIKREFGAFEDGSNADE